MHDSQLGYCCLSGSEQADPVRANALGLGDPKDAPFMGSGAGGTGIKLRSVAGRLCGGVEHRGQLSCHQCQLQPGGSQPPGPPLRPLRIGRRASGGVLLRYRNYALRIEPSFDDRFPVEGRSADLAVTGALSLVPPHRQRRRLHPDYEGGLFLIKQRIVLGRRACSL